MEAVTAVLWATAAMASLRFVALACEELLSRQPRAWGRQLAWEASQRDRLRRHHAWYGTQPTTRAPLTPIGRFGIGGAY